MFDLFLKGILVGICVSAPVGPVGVLCVQRTIRNGWKHGVFTGLGAVISDMIYALIAGYSMTFIITFIKQYQSPIQITGSIIILFFGLHIFRSNPTKQLSPQKVNNKMTYLQDFFSSFFLTIINPVIILLFIAFFAQYGFVTHATTRVDTLFGYVGILVGAVFWWTVIISVVSIFRMKFNVRGLGLINKIAGGIIMIIAVAGTILFFLDK